MHCYRTYLVLVFAIVSFPMVVQAQFGDASATNSPTGDSPIREDSKRWKVGMTIDAVGGGCQGLLGTVPVPTDWPEQEVRIVEEDISPTVRRVSYRMLEGGVKQMVVSVPKLNGGERANALVTFEVVRRELPAPVAPDTLKLPGDLPRDVRKYLSPSPYIESRHAKIKSLARELKDDTLSPWKQVEVFYDHVRDNIEYRNGKLKGALAALNDGNGDCEELTSLFIALCRAHGVPARTVWVPDHCYPEFYLEDEEGQGVWIPCQAAGTRAFGHMPDLRPILQKGDNFKVPEKKERQRYVAEFLTGKPTRGGGRPDVRFVRESL